MSNKIKLIELSCSGSVSNSVAALVAPVVLYPGINYQHSTNRIGIDSHSRLTAYVTVYQQFESKDIQKTTDYAHII